MNEEVEELVMAALTKLQKNSAILNDAVKETGKETYMNAWRDGVYSVCTQLQLALSQNAMYKREAIKSGKYYAGMTESQKRASEEFRSITRSH